MGFGLEAGLNCAKDRTMTAGVKRDTKIRYGMRLGAMADIGISDALYLQPGLYYVGNGYKVDVKGGYEEYAINMVEIPVNLMYRINNIGSGNMFVGAGPFIGFAANGYNRVVSAPVLDARSDLKIGNEKGDEVRGLDFGLGANVGYQLPAGFFVRVRAQMGLLNVRAQGDSDNYLRSVNFGFSIGYIFYRKDEQGRLEVKRTRKIKKYKSEERTTP